MISKLNLIPIAAALLLTAACAEPEGLTIEGSVEQAAGLQIQFDRLHGPTEAFEPLTKADADQNGKFTLSLPQGVEPGVYRLRVGARKMPLILDGTESQLEVSANLDGLERYNYSVQGSSSAASFQYLLGNLAEGKFQPSDVSNYIDTVANPYAAVYAAELALGNATYATSLNKAQERLESKYSGSPYGTNYAGWINAIQAQAAQMAASELIRVGQPAPNIDLPSPDGKKYALEDLKGKIVLLDFWASWCGPCRRENPTVVDIYNRYKDKGFTVYSVSLDGLDDNMRARMQQSGELDQQMEAQKNRWTGAIAADNLSWPYHVSDLKKWNTLPAQTYGVTGIPKTFLIDRDGMIAAVNPRGILEEELKKLL